MADQKPELEQPAKSTKEEIQKKIVVMNAAKKQVKKTYLSKKLDKKLLPSYKIDAFLEEFIKNGGNATQAVLTVVPTTSLSYAAELGAKYLKQVKTIARVHLEKQGFGYGKMLDVAAQKMTISKNPEWWDRLMKLADYEDFITKKEFGSGANVVNIIQAHKNTTSQYIEEAEDAEEISLDEAPVEEQKKP